MKKQFEIRKALAAIAVMGMGLVASATNFYWCGTVRNTVIAGSVQEDNGGFILWQNAKVENCTVYCNHTATSRSLPGNGTSFAWAAKSVQG